MTISIRTPICPETILLSAEAAATALPLDRTVVERVCGLVPADLEVIADALEQAHPGDAVALLRALVARPCTRAQLAEIECRRVHAYVRALRLDRRRERRLRGAA